MARLRNLSFDLFLRGTRRSFYSDSVRQCLAPQSGAVHITGNAQDDYTGCAGDGVVVYIRKNGTTLWQSPIALNDLVGVNFDLSNNVLTGDTIDFVINKRAGNSNCDGIYFDLTIDLTHGSIFTPTPTPTPIPTPTSVAGVRAFPTAEGYGANTIGGRDPNTKILHVNNLGDSLSVSCADGNSNTCTLRAALSSSGKRIVVFDVSGTVNLVNGPIFIFGEANSYLTVALDTAWHLWTASYNGSALVLYKDGQQVASTTSTITLFTTVDTMDIARQNATDGAYWDGTIDEIRISSKVRIAAWIKTEYTNQNSPSSFAAFCPREARVKTVPAGRAR